MGYLNTVFRVDQKAFVRAIQRRVATGRKSADEVVKQAAKGVVRIAMTYTPPASKGKTGAAATKQGRAAVKRDLQGGKLRAGIFEARPDALLAKFASSNPEDAGTRNVRIFVTKKGIVYGTDREMLRPNASITEMRRHHLKYWKNGRMTSAGARTRDIGRWRFIDKMVVGKKAMREYLAWIDKRRGKLASAWLPACLKLGVPIPAWVKRHGRGRGAIEMWLGNRAKPKIVVTARMPNERLRAHVQRITDWAVRTETAKMERQWKYYMKQQQQRLNRRRAA